MCRFSHLRGAAVLTLLALAACEAPSPTLVAASDQPAGRTVNSMPAPTGLSVTDQNGSPLVSWSPVAGATGYRVTLITYWFTVDQYGQEWYQGRGFSTVASTTATSLLDGDRTYTGTFKCTNADPFGGYPESQTHGQWFEYAVQAIFPGGESHIDAARIYAPIASEWGCGW